MQVVGVFRELEPLATALPSIHELKNQLGPLDAEAVSQYLESGTPVFDVMEATADPLLPGKFVPGGPSLITDGTFIWRSDLAYFVSTYNMLVPQELVKRAHQRMQPARDDAVLVASWEETLRQYEEHLGRHSTCGGASDA
jgi:hypothetical protein